MVVTDPEARVDKRVGGCGGGGMESKETIVS